VRCLTLTKGDPAHLACTQATEPLHRDRGFCSLESQIVPCERDAWRHEGLRRRLASEHELYLPLIELPFSPDEPLLLALLDGVTACRVLRLPHKSDWDSIVSAVATSTSTVVLLVGAFLARRYVTRVTVTVEASGSPDLMAC